MIKNNNSNIAIISNIFNHGGKHSKLHLLFDSFTENRSYPNKIYTIMNGIVDYGNPVVTISITGKIIGFEFYELPGILSKEDIQEYSIIYKVGTEFNSDKDQYHMFNSNNIKLDIFCEKDYLIYKNELIIDNII